MKQSFTVRQGALDGVEAFLCVAQHRSFRRAAAELGVTPSALSHSIRQLEGRLGVRLLHRTTRSVSATDAGQRLLNQLRPAMKPGVYVNFMSGDEQYRVPEAYQERWDRLVAIKTHYDPYNFFRLNQNVPPRKLCSEQVSEASQG